MKSSIILGTQFGDEGKGMTVDYLCSISKNPIVVRYSAGHNCGHCVIIGDKKHIHSSYGSGTLRGVPSFFSEHTCLYFPNILREEKVLSEMNIKPILYIHPLAKVTTPYDIAYNRTMEEENGHGSVGVGIAATMKRHLETGYKLYAMDLELSYSDILEQKLTNISDYYHNLMITLRGRNTPLYENYLRHLEVLRPDLDQYKLLYNAKSLPFEVVGYDRLSYYDSLIFEGSQGIMLDMDHGIFPNVTYANTTSKNALEILKNFSCKVEVFYVTRCYQTRHGRGWMSNVNPLPLINNEEEINLTNKWQGSFRVGDLDYSLLNYAMEVDNLYSSSLRKNLVVTCLDQLPSFKFDYSKIKTRIFCHYENSSPKYGGMIKCP